MTRLIVVGALSLSLAAMPAFAQSASDPADPGEATSRVCAEVDGTMPTNVIVHQPFPRVVREMLTLSPTFRLQCERLAGATELLVIMRIDLLAPRRFAAHTDLGVVNGRMVARMELRLAHDYERIITHEIEHLIEQLDGWDLPTMSKRTGEAAYEVREIATGVYETARAVRIERLVVSEIAAGRRVTSAQSPGPSRKGARATARGTS